MPDEMEEARVNDQGKFRTAAGTDDLSGIEGVSLSLPQSTDGLSDYQEGDECDITIKGRVGKPDEKGNVSIEVINLDLKPMPAPMKMHRRDEKNNMPPPETMPKPEDENNY